MQNKSQKILDAFMRDRLDALEPDTSLCGASFNVVKQQLVNERKRKKYLFFWWFAVLLFLVPFSIYLFNSSFVDASMEQKSDFSPTNTHEARDSNKSETATNKVNAELRNDQKSAVQNSGNDNDEKFFNNGLTSSQNPDPKASFEDNKTLPGMADSILGKNVLTRLLQSDSAKPPIEMRLHADSANKKKEDSVYIVW